jgi:holo-[acyl-carrier protein] synthase
VIYGIGTDLCEVARIRAAVDRFGPRFAQRILMAEELAQLPRAKDPIRFLAMRFAAKEAIVKAMGTGFRQGVWLRDVGMVQERSGKPVPIFSPRIRARLDAQGAGAGHVTLSDEAGMVVAVAILLLRLPADEAPR